MDHGATKLTLSPRLIARPRLGTQVLIAVPLLNISSTTRSSPGLTSRIDSTASPEITNNMVGSRYHHVPRLHPAHADPVAFRIVLKSDEGFDVHDTREFDLALDSKFAIGRASKNTSKGYLLPAKHNVYIDSPVVSREHALLTANTTSGTPQVFITDTKSMHGTFVNGTPLVSQTPKQLSNGDKLQFGVNVNRNDSKAHLYRMQTGTLLTSAGYFVAFKYTFNAELSNPEPFSRGFTVPEAESEEEELDFVHSGRGSELDPLVLDDSDAESDHSEHAEYAEDIGDVTMAQLDEEEELVDIDNSSDQEAALDDDSDDVAESDVESSVASHSPSSPLVQGAEYIEEAEKVEEVVATKQAQATSVDQARSSAPLSAPLEPERAPVDPFFLDFGCPTMPDLAFPPIPTMDQPLVRGPFDAAFAPPLPPRPSQKRQRIWDEAHSEHEHQDWFAGEPSNTSSYSAGFTDFTYPSHNVSANASQQFEPPTERFAASAPAAGRIQTPPPSLAANVVSSAASPPTHRTGVSITEIVNEQPPTPTSINSRKRSADDAFEEEAEDIAVPQVAEQEADRTPPAQSLSEATAPEEVVLPTVERTTPQSQRPIAQPRSILRKVLRAATLMVPATALGATLSIAALTALPESFFTVA